MAAYAAITLLKPGTNLDREWDLNSLAYRQLNSEESRAFHSWCWQALCSLPVSVGSSAAIGDGYLVSP